MEAESRQCLTLAQMQQVFLGLLAEFDGICKAHGLRYDLCGGSLLGAVRHQGFIPWDNDIDVAMPRPDYEQLLRLAGQGRLKLPEKRCVVSDRDRSFPRHFARYVRTDLLRDSDMMDETDCPYIGVDIFTVDAVPNSMFLFSAQTWLIRQLRRFLLTSVERKGTSRKGRLAGKIKDIYRPVLRWIGPYRLAGALDRVCARWDYEKGSYVGIINGMYGKRERWAKADMLPQAMLPFGGRDYPGYANYDIYLTNLYGDYRRLPPAEQQVPHCEMAYWTEE